MSDNNKRRPQDARGYYIALILCALAIGIIGYVSHQDSARQAAAQVREIRATQPTLPRETVPRPTVPTVPEPTRTPEKPEKPDSGKPAKPAHKTAVCAPVEGEVITEYAMECLGYNETTRDWRVHNGVDFAADAGTPVRAAADGQVYTVYEDDTMGTTVVIRHENGCVTTYASLAPEVEVAAGDPVSAGDVIGKAGSTALLEQAIGDHVHFSVTRNDVPVDPMEFLNG